MIKEGIAGPIHVDVTGDASAFNIFFRDRNTDKQEILTIGTQELANEITSLYNEVRSRL